MSAVAPWGESVQNRPPHPDSALERQAPEREDRLTILNAPSAPQIIGFLRVSSSRSSVEARFSKASSKPPSVPRAAGNVKSLYTALSIGRRRGRSRRPREWPSTGVRSPPRDRQLCGRRLRRDGRSGHHDTNGCSCDRRPVVAAIPAAPVAATRVALHDKMRGSRPFEKHGQRYHSRLEAVLHGGHGWCGTAQPKAITAEICPQKLWTPAENSLTPTVTVPELNQRCAERVLQADDVSWMDCRWLL